MTLEVPGTGPPWAQDLLPGSARVHRQHTRLQQGVRPRLPLPLPPPDVFQCAPQLLDEASSDSMSGNLSNMAPERLVTGAVEKSDVFSFGVLFARVVLESLPVPGEPLADCSRVQVPSRLPGAALGWRLVRPRCPRAACPGAWGRALRNPALPPPTFACGCGCGD